MIHCGMGPDKCLNKSDDVVSIGSYVESISRDDHLQSSAFLSEWDSEIGFDDGCDFIFYIDILYAYRVLPGTPIGKGPFSSYFKAVATNRKNQVVISQ